MPVPTLPIQTKAQPQKTYTGKIIASTPLQKKAIDVTGGCNEIRRTWATSQDASRVALEGHLKTTPK